MIQIQELNYITKKHNNINNYNHSIPIYYQNINNLRNNAYIYILNKNYLKSPTNQNKSSIQFKIKYKPIVNYNYRHITNIYLQLILPNPMITRVKIYVDNKIKIYVDNNNFKSQRRKKIFRKVQ